MMAEDIVVAVLERSAGNESVGSEWIETATFSPDAPVSHILEWAQSFGLGRRRPDGRLMISLADDRRSEPQEPA